MNKYIKIKNKYYKIVKKEYAVFEGARNLGATHFLILEKVPKWLTINQFCSQPNVVLFASEFGKNLHLYIKENYEL